MIRYLILLFFIPFQLLAQQNDAWLWTGAAVKYELNKDIRIDYETQVRLNNNWSNLSHYYNEISLKYEPFKGADLKGTYRYSRKEDEGYYFPENRFNLDFAYGIKYQGFKTGLRARYQYAFDRWRTYQSYVNIDRKTTFRIKWEANYEFDGFKRIQPFCTAEWFTVMNENTFGQTDAYRLGLGIDLDLPAKHAVKIGYQFEKEFRSTEMNGHIFVVQYAYTLTNKMFKGN